jgi:hypothetical protein
MNAITCGCGADDCVACRGYAAVAAYHRDEAINDLAGELITEPEFNPYSARNFYDAICECGEQLAGKWAELAKTNQFEALGKEIKVFVFSLWDKEAMKEAERLVDKSMKGEEL